MGVTTPAGYVVVAATPTALVIEDEHNPALYLVARLTGGRVTFGVQAVDPVTGSRGRLRGRVLFDAMMSHFGRLVDAVVADWVYGTNLSKLNELTRTGMPIVDAAPFTWTGTQCIRHGFGIMHLEDARGSPGNWQTVRLRFERGDA